MQEVLAQIPWYQNVALLEKLKSADLRLWYARQAIEHGWSRAVLVHQIETDLHGRQGKSVTNLERTLPAPQSELAQEVLKDPSGSNYVGGKETTPAAWPSGLRQAWN